MITIDIDVGGTLTDGLFSDGQKVTSVKVDTTPHDLTVCLFDCLTQGGGQFGYQDLAEFLEHVELIRWSTTITSNVLAELSGPRIGLLVSSGHEKDLYGNGADRCVLRRLLNEQDVLGLKESPEEIDIMNAARSLLESGVRRICVSLKDAHRDPRREMAIKGVIDQQYPDHFLGSVPVLAGSDISKSADDQTRTFCALVNAYTHGALAATLFKAEDELRATSRYSGTFLVSHINGGVAGIAKTKAIDTIESGPILGIHGSVHLAKAYGLKEIIAMDIGGTTAKISVIRGGAAVRRRPTDFFGIPVDMSLPDLRSVALGGGSVIKAVMKATEPEVQLGPESMGSFPGPACYGLGGDRATLTDAFVTAGLVNPDYFLGGTKQIDRQLAQNALEQAVVQPLGVSLKEACRLVIGRAFRVVAGMIEKARHEMHADFSANTLFAYGGNGGLFGCGVAEEASIRSVLFPALGPVFSAFGSSVSDISHLYERNLYSLPIGEDGAGRIRHAAEEMKAEGVQDLLGEGIRPENLEYEIELDAVAGGGGAAVAVRVAEELLRNPHELLARLAAALGNSNGGAGILAETLRVRVRKAMRKPRAIEGKLEGPDAAHALTGTRRVLWGSGSGEAKVYRWDDLRPGNRIEGCAVLEDANTTYFVPEGWSMVMDRFRNGSVSRQA
ncbi:MAG TPA: hydantoinase/oxoprolinase family protein [Candidatus Acidoferrum sp.]|nr:hydantoinase/oxoprolinase family protein [Candidatus Acidoferrum sp.]